MLYNLNIALITMHHLYTIHIWSDYYYWNMNLGCLTWYLKPNQVWNKDCLSRNLSCCLLLFVIPGYYM